jgi:hypothetical protein
MEFNFSTQPQKIMQGDKNRKDTYSISCIVAGAAPSYRFIQAPKIKLKK